MAMGYCQTFSKEALPTGKSIAELNAYMEEKMNREFMDTFRSYTKQALQWSAQKAYEGKAASIEALKAGRAPVWPRRSAWATWSIPRSTTWRS